MRSRSYDCLIVGGKVYFSGSNPANNPNNKPALVQGSADVATGNAAGG